MPASGLGSNNCEMTPKSRVILQVPPAAPCHAAAAAKKAATTGTPRRLGALQVPKGVLPTILYGAFFFMFPLLNEYMTYDYTDTMVRTSVIAAGILAPVVVVAANDCVAWYNMALAFHTGQEVVVLSKMLNYYDTTAKDTAEDYEEVLKWVAFGIVVAHLVPFYVYDQPGPLGLLAAAGIIVNTVVNVTVPDNNGQLLITGFSASVLLATVLLIVCIDCVKTSLLSQLRMAMQRGSICSVQPFEY